MCRSAQLTAAYPEPAWSSLSCPCLTMLFAIRTDLWMISQTNGFSSCLSSSSLTWVFSSVGTGLSAVGVCLLQACSYRDLLLPFCIHGFKLADLTGTNQGNTPPGQSVLLMAYLSKLRGLLKAIQQRCRLVPVSTTSACAASDGGDQRTTLAGPAPVCVNITARVGDPLSMEHNPRDWSVALKDTR